MSDDQTNQSSDGFTDAGTAFVKSVEDQAVLNATAELQKRIAELEAELASEKSRADQLGKMAGGHFEAKLALKSELASSKTYADTLMQNILRFEKEIEGLKGDRDRMAHLALFCYLPNDLPHNRELFVVVSEKLSPLGSFSCHAENDLNALRSAIDKDKAGGA
jgi:septal ring factor EnvC (AmiA/AmiB activator)